VVGHKSEFRQVRVVGRRLFGSFRERGRRKAGEGCCFFFPYLTYPGEEEDPQCAQNGTVLGFSFFFLMNNG